MRRYSILFLFAVLCVAVFPAGDAGAAASGPGEAARLYDGAARDWRALLRNAKRGETRDPWLNLEKRFLAAAASDPKGDTGARSRYQAARCREELAKRSHLATDWKYAATLYRDLAKNFPRHNLADDGLFQAAAISVRRLNNPQEARVAAQAVIDNYPKGDMAANARKLLASLPKPTATARENAKRPPADAGRPGTLMEQLGLTVRTIMIDPGHGGKDPGAMGNGIRESSVTLTLAKMLGERLRKEGYTVLYTRERDAAVALDQRPVIANTKKADLFISMHVNASKDKKTNGLETYFLDMARTSGAALVAARENAVTAKNISDLQFILTDLMLTSKLQESKDLAAIIHRQMCARLGQAGFTANDNGVRSAPFYVLMGARMPAVLVEIGYLTNNDDARRIKSAKYLERLADGIVLGVTAYKAKLGRFTGR